MQVPEENLKEWKDAAYGEWGNLKQLVRMSGLSHVTVWNAIRKGECTPKTANAINKAIKKLQPQEQA